MAMALYACTFKWIIERINARIKGTRNYASIGILDIFGFENFEVGLSWSKNELCVNLTDGRYHSTLFANVGISFMLSSIVYMLSSISLLSVKIPLINHAQ